MTEMSKVRGDDWLLKVAIIGDRFKCRPSDMFFPHRSDVFKLGFDNLCLDLLTSWELEIQKEAEAHARKHSHT